MYVQYDVVPLRAWCFLCQMCLRKDNPAAVQNSYYFIVYPLKGTKRHHWSYGLTFLKAK